MKDHSTEIGADTGAGSLEAGPVFQDASGIFRVSGRTEIEAVLKNPATFSGAVHAQLLEPFFGRNIAQLEGREHARFRGLVSAGFTPAAVERMADRSVSPVVEELIASFRGRSVIDGIADFSVPLPVLVIARLLGVEIHEVARFMGWYDVIVEVLSEFPRVTPKRAKALEATAELAEYLRPIVHERMAHPVPDDLIGQLALAELDGARLTETEILGFARGLLFAGSETTRHFLGHTLWGIFSTGSADLCRADPKLLDGAIEEGLRFTSAGAYREAAHDTTLAGVKIPAGAVVHAAAVLHHQDPAHYPEPQTFKLDRCPAHITFGTGPHVCLGAQLARTEARIGIGRLLEAFPAARTDPNAEVVFRGFGLRSPLELPIRLEGQSQATSA